MRISMGIRFARRICCRWALDSRAVALRARFPQRGSHPRELVALGIKDYRQTAFKPYRVIHRVLGRQIVLSLIVDGRRDMQSVLARRLLGA